MKIWWPLALSICCLLASPAFSQDSNRMYMGVDTCESCHGGRAVQDAHPFDAFSIWAYKDKHSRSFSDLVEDDPGKLSRHIAGWMGYPLDQPESWKKCTVCHMVDVPQERWGERFDPKTEGVGCEACHGPAEDYLVPHKYQTYEQNLAVGLYDLKDLRTRARMCLDCHTGLDHEIVAAGHPDLNFELFHFSFWQPPHWKYTEANPFNFWAIGQAAALQKTVDDLVRDSNLYQPIPEFQDKSCYNCHHKLDQDRWRQVEAHQTVVRPLVKNLLGEERARKLDEDLDRIRQYALDHLPSEDRTASLKSLGDRLTAGLVDDVSNALKSREIDRAFIGSLLLDLTQPIPDSGQGLKPHLPVAWMAENLNTAEQIYWALYTLVYTDRYLEDSSKSTDSVTEWFSADPSEGGLAGAVGRLLDYVKESKTADRRFLLDATGYNRGLEEVRDESRR